MSGAGAPGIRAECALLPDPLVALSGIHTRKPGRQVPVDRHDLLDPRKSEHPAREAAVPRDELDGTHVRPGGAQQRVDHARVDEARATQIDEDDLTPCVVRAASIARDVPTSCSPRSAMILTV
jgi:hypothetical protein